jgi:hypothetical protein
VKLEQITEIVEKGAQDGMKCPAAFRLLHTTIACDIARLKQDGFACTAPEFFLLSDGAATGRPEVRRAAAGTS